MFKSLNHRYLKKIDILMACSACLVCLVSTVEGCHKNMLGRGSACSMHTTQIEQSTFH